MDQVDKRIRITDTESRIEDASENVQSDAA